jgi:hypothetical protein
MLLCGLGKVMIRVVSLTAPAPFLSGRAMKTELHKIQRGSELRGWHAQRHGSSCLSHVTLPSASLHWPLLIHILCNELFSISFPCILWTCLPNYQTSGGACAKLSILDGWSEVWMVPRTYDCHHKCGECRGTETLTFGMCTSSGKLGQNCK